MERNNTCTGLGDEFTIEVTLITIPLPDLGCISCSLPDKRAPFDKLDVIDLPHHRKEDSDGNAVVHFICFWFDPSFTDSIPASRVQSTMPASLTSLLSTTFISTWTWQPCSWCSLRVWISLLISSVFRSIIATAQPGWLRRVIQASCLNVFMIKRWEEKRVKELGFKL